MSGNSLFRSFPEKGKSDYKGEMAKILEVLKKDTPMQVSFCMDVGIKTQKNCKAGHSVVISGYQKVCRPSGECRDALKVQNEWGQQWQDEYNGGWVDAQSLLDQTAYEANNLSWLEYAGK